MRNIKFFFLLFTIIIIIIIVIIVILMSSFLYKPLLQKPPINEDIYTNNYTEHNFII